MIVDAEMGMPIDLSRYPLLWDPNHTGEDYGTHSTIDYEQSFYLPCRQTSIPTPTIYPSLTPKMLSSFLTYYLRTPILHLRLRLLLLGPL